ncbi:MAG: hypothetical protein ABIB71_09590, partial [Candidatus Woesearchaeota archaeon]
MKQKQKELKSFLNKSFSKRRHNKHYTIWALVDVILMAAWAGHSVTDVAQAPSSDTVFYWMDTSLKRLDKEYLNFVEKVLKQKPYYWLRYTPYLLIDETHESYTGKLLKKKWKT